MKIFKTILISIIFLGAGFLTALPVFAVGVDPLVVEYSSDNGSTWQPLTGPIFSETNFLPGSSVLRLVRVTNYSGESQRIAVEAINKNDPNNLGEHLRLNIKKGTDVIFNDTLKKFFSQGETYLSDVANGASVQYDFTISFDTDTNDSFQGKILGFDIIIGFEGTEGGLTPLSPGQGIAGGGGSNGPPGGLPPGLTIQNETTESVTTDSVIISWTTSYAATSQVIYALENEAHTLNLFDNAGNPPKYGYERTTPETDNFSKVLSHSVTIDGLISGTKYYFRAVSHGSLAISTEHSFTTLTPEQAMAQAQVGAGAEVSQPPRTEENQSASSIGESAGEQFGTTTETTTAITEENPVSTDLPGGARNLAASILGLSGSWIFWIILFLILVLVLFLVIRKKKEKNNLES